MTKDMSFESLSKKEDSALQAMIWLEVMEAAEVWEEEKGVTRQAVIEALTTTVLDLASRRLGERLFQHPDQTRRFLAYILEASQIENDKFMSKKTQRLIEEKLGKDFMMLRDAKQHGFEQEQAILSNDD